AARDRAQPRSAAARRRPRRPRRRGGRARPGGGRRQEVRSRPARPPVRDVPRSPAAARPPSAVRARRGRPPGRRDGRTRRARAAAAPAGKPRVRSDARHPLRGRRRSPGGASGVITAICPGSYDPVTNGHVDVITRAAGIFDRVVVGVVGSPHHKQPMFTIDERVEFLRGALGSLTNVEIDVFRELVVEFAKKWDAKAIVKGLRVISDFEWEFQMNQLNRTLAPEVETVYVMASPQVSFVSS